MGYKDKQKELQAPDEFQKLGEQAVPWLERHGKNLGFGVLGLVAVLLVISIVRSMGSGAEEKASQDVSNVLRVLARDVKPKPAADAKPEDAAKDAPDTAEVKPAPGEEPFASEAERDAEFIKQATEVRQKHSGKPAAVRAALPLAQALLRAGKPGEAVPLVDEFLRATDANDPLRAAALEARGYAMEAQGKYDDALSAFDQLARENKTDFLKGMGLYHRGRILELKGDGTAAAKQFVDLQGQSPESAAARLAKDRLALLAAKGVAIPQPVAPPTAADAPMMVPAAVDAGP